MSWNFPDPLEAEGGEAIRREAIRGVMYEIKKRLELMVALRPEHLERLKLQRELELLGSA